MSTGKWAKPKLCNRCGGSFPRDLQHFSGKGLKQGYCRSCATAALVESQARNPKKPKHQHSRWLRSKWQQIKDRSAKRGVPFSLDMDFMREKFALTHCEATGIEFESSGAFMKSLDRRVPEQGYVPDNVQIVVQIHNVARGAWGDYDLARYVAHLVGRVRNKKLK